MNSQNLYLGIDSCDEVVDESIHVLPQLPIELLLSTSWSMYPLLSSTSKSNTISLVSSVPFRLPTAQTSLVFEHRSRQTTPPLPPESSVTKFLRNSPVLRSQIFTVPSSEDVMTNFLLNCRHVTALWCLLGPVE